MSSSSYYTSQLTNGQKDFCAYTGFFGVLIGLTCFIQHLSIFRSHWITTTLTFFYVIVIVSFLLLALKKPIAPVLLIITGIISLLIEALFLAAGLFSLAVLLLFLYNVVIVVLLYMEEIPKRLRILAQHEKKEREEWAGKI